MNTSAILKTCLKVSVSVGIITILIIKLKSDTLWETIRQVTWWQLTLGVLGYCFCQFISSFKWLQLAHSMKLGGTPLQFYSYYLQGMFLSLFLPTSIGGDFGRALMLAREKSSRWTHALLSIAAERMCGLMVLMFFITISFYLEQPARQSGLILLILVAGTLAVTVFTFGFRWIENHPWGHWLIQKFVLKQAQQDEDPGEIWPRPQALFVGTGMSVIFHALGVFLKMWLLSLLGVQLSFTMITVVYGLVGLLSLIPITLGGIGVREGSTAYLLVLWAHIPEETALAYSLIWGSVVLLSGVPGGLLALQYQLKMPSHKNI